MKRIFTLVLCLVVVVAGKSQGVVISQIYGGGGNAGAMYRNDYIELFNPTNISVNLSSYAVQYTSTMGDTWQITPLTGSIPAFSYYLIQEAQGAGGTMPLPSPNATGTITMSATAGKVALTNTTTMLSGACPLNATVVDFVGFGGTTDCSFGTGPAPAPSNTMAILRKGSGTTNTDNNSTDFTTGTPTPRNSAVILPVQLLSFTASAKNTSIVFNWKTVTETNTSHFEIEQSTDGNNFTIVATVAAAGNSAVEKSYSYTGSLNNTTTYYRLKMIDADGKFTISSIVKIATSKNGFSLGNVYPVPAKNNVTIEWNSNHTGTTSITVTDVSGRTIRSANVQAVQGFNQFVLDVQSLNAGQYFIRLKNDMNQVQTIITKQ